MNRYGSCEPPASIRPLLIQAPSGVAALSVVSTPNPYAVLAPSPAMAIPPTTVPMKSLRFIRFLFSLHCQVSRPRNPGVVHSRRKPLHLGDGRLPENSILTPAREFAERKCVSIWICHHHSLSPSVALEDQMRIVASGEALPCEVRTHAQPSRGPCRFLDSALPRMKYRGEKRNQSNIKFGFDPSNQL